MVMHCVETLFPRKLVPACRRSRSISQKLCVCGRVLHGVWPMIVLCRVSIMNASMRSTSSISNLTSDVIVSSSAHQGSRLHCIPSEATSCILLDVDHG
eukprot:684105-Prymnesium_polylepis.1